MVAGAAASCDVRFRQNLRICENDCVALILCPSGRDALRISSLPKRSTSKILLRPLPVVSPYEHFDSPFINVVANRPAGTVF